MNALFKKSFQANKWAHVELCGQCHRSDTLTALVKGKQRRQHITMPNVPVVLIDNDKRHYFLERLVRFHLIAHVLNITQGLLILHDHPMCGMVL